MATLHVTEYADISNVKGPLSIPKEPAVADQAITYTTSSVQSSAFNSLTKFVRLISDADAYVKFGENPTATTSVQRLEADIEYFRGVTPGEIVAVIGV